MLVMSKPGLFLISRGGGLFGTDPFARESAKYKERISRIWDSGPQWHVEIHEIAEIS